MEKKWGGVEKRGGGDGEIAGIAHGMCVAKCCGGMWLKMWDADGEG